VTEYNYESGMTTMLEFTVRVERVSLLYTVTHACVPLLNIYPAIETEDKEIVKLAIGESYSDKSSDTAFSAGDIISVKFTNNSLPIIKVIEKSPRERTDLMFTTCPMCGQPLVTIGQNKYCFNLTCSGQKENNLVLFASALGLVFHSRNLVIFETLISRGIVKNIYDLFSVTFSDVYTEEFTVREVAAFLKYVASVRGKLTLPQLLEGLTIFMLSTEDICDITEAFAKEGFNLSNLDKLVDKDFRNKYKEINWEPLDQYFYGNDNLVILTELGKILQC
jgi:NAD-dependent DNA ligase